MFCTSVFVYDAMFSHNDAYTVVIDEQPFTPCLRNIDLPAADSKQFDWVVERGKVCHLRLPCLAVCTTFTKRLCVSSVNVLLFKVCSHRMRCVADALRLFIAVPRDVARPGLGGLKPPQT